MITLRDTEQRVVVRMALAALFDRVETATALGSSELECVQPDFMEAYREAPDLHTHANGYVYGALDHTGTMIAFALGGEIGAWNEMLVPEILNYIKNHPDYPPAIDELTEKVLSHAELVH